MKIKLRNYLEKLEDLQCERMSLDLKHQLDTHYCVYIHEFSLGRWYHLFFKDYEKALEVYNEVLYQVKESNGFELELLKTREDELEKALESTLEGFDYTQKYCIVLQEVRKSK